MLCTKRGDFAGADLVAAISPKAAIPTSGTCDSVSRDAFATPGRITVSSGRARCQMSPTHGRLDVGGDVSLTRSMEFA